MLEWGACVHEGSGGPGDLVSGFHRSGLGGAQTMIRQVRDQ